MTSSRLHIALFTALYFSSQLLGCPVPCLSLSIVQTNVSTGRASPARPKNDFSVRELETVVTPEGLPAVERLSSVSLPSGKLLLLLNSCSKADEHDSSSPPLDEQVFFGCDINLQQIDPSNNWQRSQTQLLSSTELPEVRGLGLWAEETNGVIDKVIVLIWSASCKTQQETCRCSSKDGCKISFGGDAEASCLSSIYEGKVAPKGARLCQGKPSTDEETNGECYYYSLEANYGWVCGSAAEESVENGTVSASTVTAKDTASWLAARQDIWNRHGVRLGSALGVRYGSILVAEFNGIWQLQWIKSIGHNALIPLAQEQRAAIVGGDVNVTDRVAKKQYAVTLVREIWERKAGKVVVSPKCKTILLNSSATLEGEQLQGSECESCLYTSASIHPKTRRWASMCISTKLPKLGISINGSLVVNSSKRYQTETQSSLPPDESLSYYKDTGGRLLPVEGGKWVLIWREASWKVSTVEGITGTSATLKAAVWEGLDDTLGNPVSLLGPVLEQRLMNADAVSLSLESAVVTVADYVNEEAMAAIVDLSDLSIQPASTVTVAGVQGGALFGRIYGHPLLRVSESTALWLGAAKENNSPLVGPSTLLPEWAPSTNSRAVLMSVDDDEEDCEGQWEATTSTCPSSCLQKQVFRSTKSGGDCPWGAHAFRLIHCEGGDCPDWRKGAVFFAGSKTVEANNLVDKNLSSKVKMGPALNAIELRLAEPVDLQAVEVYLNRADVSLLLSIQDAEENWVSTISSAFRAPPAEMDDAAYPWVTRYLSLKRVSALQLQAAPLTSATAGTWAVDILEVRLQSTPSLPCTGGGFSDDDKDCETASEIPPSLEALDCKGDWQDWSICDTSCTRVRQFTVTSPPKKGGRPCLSHEVEACTGGGLCSIPGSSSRAANAFLPQRKDAQGSFATWSAKTSDSTGSSTNCASSLSPKSQCVSCRTLQTYQITRQATGEGQRCPEERFVLDYCDDNCANAYGPTTTTTRATTATLPVLTSPSSPSLNMQNARDVMLLLRTIAIYFLVVLLACLITAYLVGLFEGGLVHRKAEGCLDHSNAPPPIKSPPTTAAVSGYSGAGSLGAETAPRRNSRMSKGNSGSSRRFGSSIQTLRQSLLGGNLLPNTSDSDSDCLDDTSSSSKKAVAAV
ncbi:hypothetical protein, conserved [Eimeria praecox]|uniref:Thrombospondin type 1 domain-containing protein n=1 Tax=Eimeria praecox TaxID=51316 RepID=U6G8A8_9EIME|nr:hypothetical protein, conserved [Eimeria praecox]